MRVGQENLVLLYILLLVPMVISVRPQPGLHILTGDQVKTVHQGDNVTFKCYTMRDPLTKIRWTRNLVINGSSVDTHGKPYMEMIKPTKHVSSPELYTITNISSADAGKYTCYAVNAYRSSQHTFELKVIPPGHSKSGFKVEDVHPFNTENKYSYYGGSSSGSSSGLIWLVAIPIILIKIGCYAWCCYWRAQNRKVIVRTVVQQVPANGNNTQQPQQQPSGLQQQPPSYAYVASAGLPPEYGQHHGYGNFPNPGTAAAPVMMGGMKKMPEAPSLYSTPGNANNGLDQPMEDTRIGVPYDERLISRI